MRPRHRSCRWQHHGPDWGHEPEGQDLGPSGGPPLPPWLDHDAPRHHWPAGGHRPPSGQQLFFRFAFVFGLFVFLGCALLAVSAAVLILLVPRSLPAEPLPPSLQGLHWLRFIPVLFLVLLVALWRVGRAATRRFTTPLSDTMHAAEALADGDLSARVPVRGGPEFRHLAHSFNRMAQSLETADRQRRELLADVAHELRTPLTVIQGNLEGLRDGVYQPTAEHLDLVLDETERLARLVEDLRLLTLAEAGQLPLDPQVLDVAQLLADVRDLFAHQAAEAGVSLEVEMAAADQVPALVADPQRLAQVLGNLVTNALRHTPEGGHITLGAETWEVGEALCLWVADTGEGIPPQDLPRVFDRFWRADRARTRGVGAGSGLGLAIARSLVALHGGRIWAESEGVPGRGTVVSFVLPLASGA